MENNYLNIHDHEEEDLEDALSLCNLPIHDQNPESDELFYQEPPNLSFEFFTESSDHEITKLIPYEQEDLRSIPKPFASAATRSNSFRFPIPKHSQSRAPMGCRYTATSRSWKHNFTFTPEKFRPDMELSDIRKRQSRRPPAPMFLAVDGPKTRNQHWGLIWLIRRRSHSGCSFAKALFGCLPHL